MIVSMNISLLLVCISNVSLRKYIKHVSPPPNELILDINMIINLQREGNVRHM